MERSNKSRTFTISVSTPVNCCTAIQKPLNYTVSGPKIANISGSEKTPLTHIQRSD
ncbi:hypothetical protein MESS4_830320 [Mesorhizobium sp. STM 4661]|nr:hypothetical protein MESS4_830320 [Mesorhizobium sp. STM 4661]